MSAYRTLADDERTVIELRIDGNGYATAFTIAPLGSELVTRALSDAAVDALVREVDVWLRHRAGDTLTEAESQYMRSFEVVPASDGPVQDFAALKSRGVAQAIARAQELRGKGYSKRRASEDAVNEVLAQYAEAGHPISISPDYIRGKLTG